MKYFEPYESDIMKQIYIPDVQEEHITEKTVIRHITKNDDYELLNPDHILMDKKDRLKFENNNVYHITIDNSVWIILGKANDMYGDKIPRAYNLALIGKLYDIDISLYEINHNRKIVELFEKNKYIKDNYESLMTKILCKLSKEIPDFISNDSDINDAKNILEYYYDELKNTKRCLTRYKIITFVISILFIILLFIIFLFIGG